MVLVAVLATGAAVGVTTWKSESFFENSIWRTFQVQKTVSFTSLTKRNFTTFECYEAGFLGKCRQIVVFFPTQANFTVAIKHLYIVDLGPQ